MAQRKPFTFAQAPARAPPPPPPPEQRPPPGSARSQLLLANAAKLRAAAPELPPKKKKKTEFRRKQPPKRRKEPHPALLDMKAHGLTRENAAKIVQRHATAAPVIAEENEWRPEPEVKELPDLKHLVQGFYGSAEAKQTAQENAKGLHGVQLTERLTSVLRPHQLEGVAWVCARLWQRKGCLLADEMGLGKTATCLASLAVLMGIEGSASKPTARSFRSVVCCPAGVQRTWAAEAAKWLVPTPTAAARAQSGGPRHLAVYSSVDVQEARDHARQRRLAERVEARCRKKFKGSDTKVAEVDDDVITRFAACALEEKPLLIISYESYRVHADRIHNIRDVGLLILDEAHRLKGGDCVQVNECISRDRAPRRLLVTATPVQNGVADLRSLLELAGALHDRADDASLRDALRTRTLRRSVAESPLNLPPLRDCVVFCRPSAIQRRVHAQFVTGGAGNALSRVNRARHLLSSVNAVDKTEDDLASMGKWAFAGPLLDQCRARGERVVFISQFSGPLKAARRLAESKNWPAATIDGATSLEARDDAQIKLNSGSQGFFLLCLALRAGGVGLTLTGASRVILWEPSWNPSDDAQAVARVWRWGQTRETRVYRLATCDSIEERVLVRQAAKMQLCERVAHLQSSEALLETCLLEEAFDAKAKRDENAESLCALGVGGVTVACAAARAADAAFVACDEALASVVPAARVDGEVVVRGVRCRARIEL